MIHFTDPHLTVHIGDCREVLATLPERSVHTVVTSPPYWGLRDYGVGGQLGLEPTPEEYVANMVAVFREVRRVLRDDGTVWLMLSSAVGDKRLRDSGSALADGGTEAGRNLRSVWQIATQPYPGAHFATFPEALVEPCVKAGTSERGVCPECGAPWEPVIERTRGRDWNARKRGMDRLVYGNGTGADMHMDMDRIANPPRKVGTRPTCRHDLEPVPATVLDPFAGSGTVGRVANRLGRRAVLIDLSADYIDQAMARNAQAPLGMIG